MNEFAGRLAGPIVRAVEDENALEFEARLADSSALAFRVAFSVLRQRQDAEDVAQQAFVRAYRRFSSLRDRERFRSWLVRMTWRLALDHRRGDRRRAVREDRVAPPETTGATVETDALADERRRRLWAAIDQLPEKLRLVIVLAAIEEQSVREIAALAKIPEGTVKSRLFDARKRLQEMLR
jgi:RNA polymerase sigma-70 factor (ECF subfamily)